MSKSLLDVIVENISSFSTSELITLKDAIDKYFDSDDLKLQALKIIKEKGKLYAIKYVKDKTGLGLEESKDFCNSLILHDNSNK
jgi:hypothetical protein